jgi:hypothetical protein
MAITATYGTLSASEHSTQLRKAVIASTIGCGYQKLKLGRSGDEGRLGWQVT